MRISRACAERTHLTTKLWVADKPTDAAPPLAVPLGPADRSVSVEPVYEGRPELLTFRYTDAEIAPGVNPYWIRVTQRDMHNAWSSPIFVNL